MQKCTNYRGIEVMSHILKFFERFIDWIRLEYTVSEFQFGFLSLRPYGPYSCLRVITMEMYRINNVIILDM